jgi:hypothetical protein
MIRPIILAVAAGLFLLPAPAFLSAQSQQAAVNPASRIGMPARATGPFDVKLIPQDDKFEPAVARMTIDKQFHGALEATSKGQMISTMGTVKGSAGYVAIEVVNGTLAGRKGSFALQHFATMDRGTPSLQIIVVPDSGTGQLAGLTGKMNIIIASDGKHSYDFEYSLPSE